MKKLTSIFLVLVMLLSLAPMNIFVAAADEETAFSDMKATDYYAKAATALSQLGVISGYPDGTYGAEKSITRAEMAAIVCRLIDKEADAEKAMGETEFDDVASDHWASGYINIATEASIIAGDGNGKFRPEDNVKYEEAIKMVVCALGYADDVEIDPDDWSKAFLEIADSKSITVGLKGKKGTSATRGDIAVMAYNGLKTESEDSKIPVAPTASLAGGTYTGAQKTTLSTVTKDAEIYYTTDGTNPTDKSTKYSKEISISESCTLKAVAVKNGVLSDSVLSVSYTIEKKKESFTGTIVGGSSRPSGNTDIPVVTPTSCRVTFDANNGDSGVYQVQTVSYGEKIVKPEDPTRNLYRFKGWYLESSAITEYDFNTPVNGDFTVYAGWGNPDGTDDGLYAASDSLETILSVSDISVNNNVVTVTYNTNDVALMAVEFFEDKMENGAWTEENLNANLSLTPIATATGYTEEYGELVTIDLPIDGELPTYFLARATLTDSESNSVTYVTAEYTGTYAAFNAQTVADFDDQYVINFDDDNTTNFGVIKQSVIVVPVDCQFTEEKEFVVEDVEKENLTLLSDENDNDSDSDSEIEAIVPDHIYTFPNKDAVISVAEDGTEYKLCDLEVGDIIYVEDTTYMFKIGTVTVNDDGSISFTPDKDVSMIDFYDVLKVDIDYDEAEEDAEQNARLSFDVDANPSIELGPYSIEKKFFNEKLELSGSISVKFGVNITLAFDAHLFSGTYFETSVECSTEVTGEVKAEIKVDNNDEFKVQASVPDGSLRANVPTNVPGLFIYISPDMDINWKLSGDVSFTFIAKQTSGFKYNSDTGRTDIAKKEISTDIMAKGKAEAKIGPILRIGVEFLDEVLSVGINAGVGIKATAEVVLDNFSDDINSTLNNVDSKHACTLCLSGSASWYAEAYLECKYKLTKHLTGTIAKLTILDVTSPLYFDAFGNVYLIGGIGRHEAKFFVSILNTAESKYGGHVHMGGGDCENKRWRTQFKTLDEDGNEISGIQVKVTKLGESGKTYTGNSPFTEYLYDGNYTVSAKINGNTVSRTFVVSGNAQSVVLSADSVDTVLEGVVVNAEDTNEKLSGVTVKVSNGDVVVASAETDANGKFSFKVPSGSLLVEFTKEGFVAFTSTETIYDGDNTHPMGLVELTPGTGMGGFRGIIKDATTGESLSGVTLKLYEGWNNSASAGTAKVTLTTNDSGAFRFNTLKLYGKVLGLKSGNYTLTAKKDGYADTSYNIVIYPGTTDENPLISETMSPDMLEGNYRVVLTWGEYPHDLDSHLVANTDIGGRIHVAYYAQNPAPCYANLDVDDVTSYGPETVTITNFEGLSNITYAVHDYSNKESSSSSALANSGAVVRLYKGYTLLRTFNVPVGYGGTEWVVFSLDTEGHITTINNMKYTTAPSSVMSGSATANVNTLSLDLLEADYETVEAFVKDYEFVETEDEAA